MPLEPLVGLDRTIEAALTQDGSHTEFEIADLLPVIRRELQRILTDEMNLHTQRNIPYRFRWADPTMKRDLVVIHDATEESRHLSMRDALHGLQGRQFEYVCMELLSIYGVSQSDCRLTAAQGDGGVDFYAILPGSEAATPNRLASQQWRLVGQATVSTPSVAKVGSFCHRLNQIRSETGRYWEDLDGFFRENSSPVIGMFVALDELGPTASYDSRQSVVVFIDGKQVAADLMRSGRSANWHTPDGQFSTQLFLADFPVT